MYLVGGNGYPSSWKNSERLRITLCLQLGSDPAQAEDVCTPRRVLARPGCCGKHVETSSRPPATLHPAGRDELIDLEAVAVRVQGAVEGLEVRGLHIPPVRAGTTRSGGVLAGCGILGRIWG